MVDSIIATQAREGIKTTREQAKAAYAKAQSRPNSSRIESSRIATQRKLIHAGRSRAFDNRRTNCHAGSPARYIAGWHFKPEAR